MIHQLKNTIEAIRNYPLFLTMEQAIEMKGTTRKRILKKVALGKIREYEKDGKTYYLRSQVLFR